MKAHEFFGALIRAIGVWQIANGLVLLPSLTNYYGQPTGFPRAVLGRALWTVIVTSGVHIAVGVLLFAGANWLVRLAYARRVPPERPDDGLQPLGSLPPAVKTTLLAMVAVGLSALYLWFSAGRAQTPPIVPAVFHFVMLIAIGSAALAFMFRRQWRPVNAFLAWWSVLVGLEVFINSFRY